METGNIIIEKEIRSKTSNNTYQVIIFENAIVCTCPAGGKKQICKHMVNVIHENLEIIKEKTPEFYNKLMKAIEIKFAKDIPVKEKLKEYAKVVYVNKEIAMISHKNFINRDDEHEAKAMQFISIIKDCRSYELYRFANISSKSPNCLFYSPKYKELAELEEAGFIKIFQITPDIYKKCIHYAKEELRKKLKEHNIKCLCKYNKEQTIKIAEENNFFENDINNYCLISATEQITDNRVITGYLYKESGRNITNKKILEIEFLEENYQNKSIDTICVYNINSEKPKKFMITLLLCMFLGFTGAHRLYTGHIVSGFFQLFTSLTIIGIFATFIWVLIDFICINLGSFKTKSGECLIR